VVDAVKEVVKITRLKGKADEWETLFDLLIDENGEVTMTVALMDEDDIRRIMNSHSVQMTRHGVPWLYFPE
jgi:hypothetical protein